MTVENVSATSSGIFLYGTLPSTESIFERFSVPMDIFSPVSNTVSSSIRISMMFRNFCPITYNMSPVLFLIITDLVRFLIPITYANSSYFFPGMPCDGKKTPIPLCFSRYDGQHFLKRLC